MLFVSNSDTIVPRLVSAPITLCRRCNKTCFGSAALQGEYVPVLPLLTLLVDV